MKYNLHFKKSILLRSEFNEFWWIYTVGSNTLFKIWKNVIITNVMPLYIQPSPHQAISALGNHCSIYSRGHISGIIQCVPFCVGFLSISMMFLKFINVVAFYCCIGFYCMALSQSVYSSICWWKFEFFPVLGNCEWRICV